MKDRKYGAAGDATRDAVPADAMRKEPMSDLQWKPGTPRPMQTIFSGTNELLTRNKRKPL